MRNAIYHLTMCGKFTQMIGWGALVDLADLIGAPPSPTETVTPMRYATVIRLGREGRREAVKMRWGFVPAGAKDPSTSPRHIHARAEEIELRPTFKSAFFERRGLVVVSSFNEGEDLSPTKRVQHVITSKDRKPLAIAVIWEEWGENHAGSLLTFAMVTTSANRLIGTITDRMPATIQAEDWGKWLGEESAAFDDLKAMLTPFEGDWEMRRQDGKPGKPAPEPDQPTLF